MPLGDPGGGRFEYTTEGLPENVVAVTIPVSDVGRSVAFYADIMKLEIKTQTDNEATLSMDGTFVMLRKSGDVGKDTGIYFGVRDPFEFHRRMVDEGVVFVRHPERGPIGVYASFRDPDVNVIHVVERTPSKPLTQ